MSGVTLTNAVKKYGDVQVIYNVDLEIEDGKLSWMENRSITKG